VLHKPLKDTAVHELRGSISGIGSLHQHTQRIHTYSLRRRYVRVSARDGDQDDDTLAEERNQ
jgi:hypothetical protein